jgi:acyl carrier protein
VLPDHEIARSLTNYIVTEVASRPPEKALAADFPIIEGGLVDSLGLFKLVSFIEDEFKVKIAPEEILFENFATVGVITNLIRGKLSAAGAARR